MDSPSHLPSPGDVVAGKYEVTRELGRGGMSAVFEARHEITQKRVALKLLLRDQTDDPEVAARFLREAKLSGRIDHPNVVDVFDVGYHEDRLFLVMELLRGEPLRARMSRGPMEAEAALAIFFPVLRGLAAAHALRVVHRDLKPDNIFLAVHADGSERGPILLDFGISKRMAATDTFDTGLTREGSVLGTPTYMSPEQARNTAGVDHRSDLYAVGVMLYEALAGRPPFQAETFSALVIQIATEPPPPLRDLRPDLPAGLEAIVMELLAKNPDERPFDVSALAARLEPFAGGLRFEVEPGPAPLPGADLALQPTAPSGSGPVRLHDTATPTKLASDAEGARRRARWWVPALAAAALTVIVLGALLAGGGEESTTPSSPPSPQRVVEPNPIPPAPRPPNNDPAGSMEPAAPAPSTATSEEAGVLREEIPIGRAHRAAIPRANTEREARAMEPASDMEPTSPAPPTEGAARSGVLRTDDFF